MIDPNAYIQNGYQVTYGADGGIKDIQKLNPQQLATDESAAKVLDYVRTNISEGNTWTLVNQFIGMTNANHQFNCPCWVATAQNGKAFNAGELYYNLFERNPPTQSVVDELHREAGS